MTLDPKVVGAQIRVLLLSIHAPGHSAEDERIGVHSYNTDRLRREALDYAGLCWLTPGEMAPMCCCDWSLEKPTGPRKELQARLAPHEGPCDPHPVDNAIMSERGKV